MRNPSSFADGCSTPHGETSQALRDLSISLGKLGDLRLEMR